jgi:hypothetical protein
MRPEVLFWFYKDFEVCENRLRLFRRFNREVRIYGLYGGPLSETEGARKHLDSWLDDFYFFPEDRDPHWKWRNGDRIIAAWHRDRGHKLDWETIFVLQWDMLLLAPVETLFQTLRPGEILLSGYRPLKEVEAWWPWVNKRKVGNKEDFESFKKLLSVQFNYTGELFACLFIVVCLSRQFLDRYVEIGPPECGFLEYKIPTIAKVFDTPVCLNHPFQPWWAANPDTKSAPLCKRTLNAIGQEVPLDLILGEATRPNGQRIFHPVFTKIRESELEAVL